jgi:5-methylcytosine-specific restriction protein A
LPVRAQTLQSIKKAKATPKPENRPSAAKRGYGARWQKVRMLQLMQEPLCAKCKEEDKIVNATVVDHIIPHKGDPELMWDRGNHQSLCKRHHDIKTATEDGGFGHNIKIKD